MATETTLTPLAQLGQLSSELILCDRYAVGSLTDLSSNENLECRMRVEQARQNFDKRQRVLEKQILRKQGRITHVRKYQRVSKDTQMKMGEQMCSGRKSIREVARIHGVSPSVASKWRDRYQCQADTVDRRNGRTGRKSCLTDDQWEYAARFLALFNECTLKDVASKIHE